MANNHECICPPVSSHSPCVCCVSWDFHFSCGLVTAGCLALWRGGPAAPRRTCATCSLRWIPSSRPWPLSTSSTKSCWDLSSTDDAFLLVAALGWQRPTLQSSPANYTSPFLTVICVCNLSMYDTIYSNTKKKSTLQFFFLLHHTVQDGSSLSQRTLVSLVWFGLVGSLLLSLASPATRCSL